MQRHSKVIYSVILGLLLFGVASLYIASKSETKPTENVVASTVQVNTPSVDELFKLVNEERAKVGVAPLILDERLNRSAQQKADDMVANNYFSHSDKNGRHGYDIAHEYAPDICLKPGENLTDNIYTNDSKSAIAAFVSSPKHYEAMKSTSYTYTGFGISGTKIVEHFC